MEYDILPKTNLRAEDIRDTLNSWGGNVGNEIVSLFSDSAKINKWSKYKPVPLKQDFTDFNSEWWKGYDGNCGLIFPATGGEGTYMEAISEKAKYKYYTLSDQSYFPMRLGDFRSYYPYASVPFNGGWSRDFTISNQYTYFRFGFSFTEPFQDTNDDGEEVNLLLKDIGNGVAGLMNMYPTIVVQEVDNNNKKMFFQSSNPIGWFFDNSEYSGQIILDMTSSDFNPSSTDLAMDVEVGTKIEVFAFFAPELMDRIAIRDGYRSSFGPSLWVSAYFEYPIYQSYIFGKEIHPVEMYVSFAGTDSYWAQIGQSGDYGTFRLDTIRISLSYKNSQGQPSTEPNSFRIIAVAVDNDDNYIISYQSVIDRTFSQSVSAGALKYNLDSAKTIQFEYPDTDPGVTSRVYNLRIYLQSADTYKVFIGQISAKISHNGSRWILSDWVAN